MGMKEEVDERKPTQQLQLQLQRKRRVSGYDKEGKSLKKEWKDADGNNRRVHEKDKRKDKKHNVMDSYRQMWEDARQMTYKRLQFLEKNSKKLKRVIQLK